MRALKQSIIVAPIEPMELVVLEYWQDQIEDPSLCNTTQVIPITAIKIETYEQSYHNSNSTDLVTQTRYISPVGQVDADEFSMVQPIAKHNTLACVSVITLRAKGANQVCLIEPTTSDKNWLNQCSAYVNPNLYITHSSGEMHPVLVDLKKLQEDLELTFNAATSFKQGSSS